MKISAVLGIAWAASLVVVGGIGYAVGNAGLESAVERELAARAALICPPPEVTSDDPANDRLFRRRAPDNSPGKEF